MQSPTRSASKRYEARENQVVWAIVAKVLQLGEVKRVKDSRTVCSSGTGVVVRPL